MTIIRNLAIVGLFAFATYFTAPAPAEAYGPNCTAVSQSCQVANGQMGWGEEPQCWDGYVHMYWYCVYYTGEVIGQGYCNTGQECTVPCFPGVPCDA